MKYHNSYMFDKLPLAYANNKMIFDENRVPLDFIFLDVNQKFGKLLSKNTEDIIGKKTSEILPDIYNNQTNWVTEFGKAVLENRHLEITEFCKSIHKWCKIYLYPTEND